MTGLKGVQIVWGPTKSRKTESHKEVKDDRVEDSEGVHHKFCSWKVFCRKKSCHTGSRMPCRSEIRFPLRARRKETDAQKEAQKESARTKLLLW